MICVLCENEVAAENELGLCSDCNNNFISGLVGYRNAENTEDEEKRND